ncbi:MAG: hypothetical protein HXS40_00455 [Theionarchaea archaeon]|nr:hypothetical protein [Theionarchaea archaeon]
MLQIKTLLINSTNREGGGIEKIVGQVFQAKKPYAGELKYFLLIQVVKK